MVPVVRVGSAFKCSPMLASTPRDNEATMSSLPSAPFGSDLDERTTVAEAETPSAHQWVKLSAYAEQKMEQIESPHIAEQLVRSELDLGLPCRYVVVGDLDGREHTELPSGYNWREAQIDWAISSAIWPERIVTDPSEGYHLESPTSLYFSSYRFLQLEIHKIEVLVPAEVQSPPATTLHLTAAKIEGPSAEQLALAPPTPIEPVDWVVLAIEQQREPGESRKRFAERMEPVMAAAHKDGKVKKAWAKGTIRNKISTYKLWPK